MQTIVGECDECQETDVVYQCDHCGRMVCGRCLERR